MAGRQELKLLTYLSSATSTQQFNEMLDRILKLRLKVVSKLQQHKWKLLTDGLFVTQLCSAASSAFTSICDELSRKEMLEPADSDAMSSLLAVANNLLRAAVWLTALDPAAAAEAQGSLAVPSNVLLGKMQGAIRAAGLLDSVAQVSAALSAAISKFVTPQKTKNSKPHLASAPAAVHIKATSSVASAVLDMWSVIGAVWGAARGSATAADARSTYIRTNPALQATIQPSVGLIMALLRLECHCKAHHSNIDTAADLDTDAGNISLLQAGSQHTAYLWESVFVLSADISSAGMSVHAQGRWWATDDAAASAIKETVTVPEVQELQLFILAAVANVVCKQRLHQQQQATLSVVLHETAACSAWVLQQLGLTEELAQQFFEAAVQNDSFESIVTTAISMLGLGCSSERLFPSSTASTFEPQKVPMLKLKLLIHVMLLLPEESIMIQGCTCLRQVVDFWYLDHTSYGAASSQVKGAVAAAVADSILAPLLLEVGPVVLGMKLDSVAAEWATAVQRCWAFVLLTAPGTYVETYEDIAKTKLAGIIQQQPITAATAIDATLRAATAKLQAGMDHAFGLEGRAIPVMLDMLYMTLDGVADNRVVHAATAEALCVTFNSSMTSSISHNISWPTFSTQSQAAKPFSLFISSLKFVGKFVAFMDKSERMQAVKIAELAFNAARRVADAAAAHVPGCSNSNPTAVAVPWVHIAARALHCCATVMSFRDDRDDSYHRYPFSYEDTCFLFHLWPRLSDSASWLVAQLTLLTRHCGSSSCSNSCIMSNSCAAASPVPKEMAQQVLQQSRHLQSILMATKQRWRDFGGGLCDDVGHQAQCQDVFQVAEQLQQKSAAICTVLPTLLCCNNPSCSIVSGVSELSCVGRRKCSRWQAAGYCSRECQKQHWSQHKMICK